LEQVEWIDTAQFTELVGSGGFGLIMGHASQPRALKLYYDAGDSGAARHEASLMAAARTAIGRVSHLMTQLGGVPQPLGHTSASSVAHNHHSYACALEMERVRAPPGVEPPGLVHVILRAGYESRLDRHWGRDTNNRSIGAHNPSRGFFATPAYLESLLGALPAEVRGDLVRVADVVERCGFMWAAIVALGNVVPLDVEFLLGLDAAGQRLSVWALDYNLAQAVPADATAEAIARLLVVGVPEAVGAGLDLYIPDGDGPWFEAWKKGATIVVAHCRGTGLASPQTLHGLILAIERLQDE
jgi:hypothetical protein